MGRIKGVKNKVKDLSSSPNDYSYSDESLTSNKKINTKNETKVTSEEQIHLDARDNRIKGVKSAIALAKELRDQSEKGGVQETPGAKLDREEKEKNDLAAAAVLYIIEPVGVDTNNSQVELLAKKVNDVIDYLNKKSVITKVNN